MKRGSFFPAPESIKKGSVRVGDDVASVSEWLYRVLLLGDALLRLTSARRASGRIGCKLRCRAMREQKRKEKSIVPSPSFLISFSPLVTFQSVFAGSGSAVRRGNVRDIKGGTFFKLLCGGSRGFFVS